MDLDCLLISQDAALLGVARPAMDKIAVKLQVCAESQQASNLLVKRKFDGVIIDCDDLQNGSDLLRTLRQSKSNPNTVCFAVVNGKTTTQEAFQSGANFVLQKPLTSLQAARCFNAALDSMVRERRRYFRHPVDIPLRIKSASGQEMTANTTNVSEEGMAIRVVGTLPREKKVQVRFTLPNSSTALELQGLVAWADGASHAGIRFVDVPQNSQYQLEKWLTDRLHEDISANLYESKSIR